LNGGERTKKRGGSNEGDKKGYIEFIVEEMREEQFLYSSIAEVEK